MSTFRWNGEVYPMPPGWDGLSVEDWFCQLERVRDHLMHVDEEDLEPIYSNGSYLDPEEVLLIRVYGFRSGGHWEVFRNWGVASWAAHCGRTPPTSSSGRAASPASGSCGSGPAR